MEKKENRFTWKEFQESEYGYYDDMKKFFQGLHKNWKNKTEDTVMLFVSRRAFCVYLLMKNHGELTDWKGISIYTDRYISRQMEYNFWKEKTILLIDDSIIEGTNIKSIYENIKRKLPDSEVITYILMGETKWKNNKKLKKDINLNIQRVCSLNEIFRLSSMESSLFYQAGIPYTVDLPLIVGNVKETEGVLFSEEEWQQFCKNTSGDWTYMESVQWGYLQNDMTCGCLIMENNVLKSKFEHLIQNIVVRVQFIPRDDQIEVFFVPFVLLRSISYKELRKLAEVLLVDIPYMDEINDFEKSCNEESLNYKIEIYDTLYRTVVFVLSRYIGCELQQYLENYYNKRTEYYYEYCKHSFSEGFIESIRNMFDGKMGFAFSVRLLLSEDIEKITSENKMGLEIKSGVSKEYSYERAYNTILDIKNKIPAKTGKSFISMEEVEEYFAYNFIARERENLRDEFSNCICALLNQGVLVNSLVYDTEEDVIRRGFTFGENADVFYSISAKVFYAAVKKYYEIIGEQYQEKYNFFVLELHDFFVRNFLYGTFISEDEFEFYEKYYKDADVNGHKIIDKEFLLDEANTPYYINIVVEHIEKLDYENS